MYEESTKQANTVVTELLEQAKLKPGALLVVGCSSSEMVGQRIGKGSSMEAAQAAFKGIYPVLQENGIAAHWGTLVEGIINRRGTGPCPFEAAVMDIQDSDEALTAIRRKMEQM